MATKKQVLKNMSIDALQQRLVSLAGEDVDVVENAGFTDKNWLVARIEEIEGNTSQPMPTKPQHVPSDTDLREQLTVLLEQVAATEQTDELYNRLVDGDEFTSAELSALVDQYAAQLAEERPELDADVAAALDGDGSDAPAGKVKKAKKPKAPKAPKEGPRANRRLSDEQVIAIREMRAETGASYNQIAAKFGVSGVFVRNICLGLLYKDITKGVAVVVNKAKPVEQEEVLEDEVLEEV
jgi:hypothetical protein